MKILKTLLLTLIILLILVISWAWTSDTQFEHMRAKYANEASEFINLGNNERLHYRDQGRKLGPVLILIHGTSSSLHTWGPLVSRLKNDVRLVSFDLPGHGLTGANADADYSMSKFVASVNLVMDELGIERATLVGNSLGGAVAWEAALALNEKVESLVLIAPSGAPRKVKAKSNIGFKLLSSPVGPFLINRFTPRAIIKTSIEQTVYKPSNITAATVDRYWELLRLDGNRKAMFDLSKTQRRDKPWEALRLITQPTLIIWGKEDNLLTVDMANVFNSEIPNSSLVLLEDVGHLPMEESVERVSVLISNFIAL